VNNLKISTLSYPQAKELLMKGLLKAVNTN